MDGPTVNPREVAEALRTMPIDDALDLLKEAANMQGEERWTEQLNLVGLLLLKPDAERGEEREA